MILKKITINNFRSYYKSNTIQLSSGLNLIIGSNGDGKTTMFEALEWLFRTDGTNRMDPKHISKKRAEELLPGESDDVVVSVDYEHKGKNKTLEKRFHFTKSYDGEISTSNYSFYLWEGSSFERFSTDGNKFESDFPSVYRKYTMFKGESNLDVFQQSNALKQLVDTFSDVKDFDNYFAFMKLATEKANEAKDHAQKSDRKNAEKINGLNKTIERETGILSDIEREIRQKGEETVNFDTLLRNIEQSKEASKLLNAVNRRIDNLTQKRNDKIKDIKENYTIDLLDQKWILLGFEDIAEEYSQKVNDVDKKRRKLEQEYLMEMGAHKIIKKMQTDFVPLPAHIPGPKIMQEMLDEEVCKFCGQKAPKGSIPWNYMQQRLEEYKQSLKSSNEDDDIEPYYKNSYIVELQKRDTTLTDHLEDITKLKGKVLSTINSNNKLHEEIKKIDANLEIEFENKKRILAQADGLTEEQLTANFENISTWINKKNDAENRLSVLKNQRAQHREILEEAQDKLSKLAEGTEAAQYTHTWSILCHIAEAFKNAKETNKKRLMCAIEDEANHYLESLNANDFMGSIRIIEKANDQGEAVLMNNDDTRIYNPNTALRTTYLMSVLFAIGKLSGQRDHTEFPLIFDAPTSSFSDAKESEFFNVIGNLDKQVIIVTKSFLKDSGNGNVVLDSARLNLINGNILRIEKKKPFDDKNLATIQTVISKIK